MGLFDWKPEYSIGCPPIDLQHKQIFRMAAELHAAMVNHEPPEVTEPLLDKVVGYTRFHFAAEEKLMQESGYRGYEQHHASHERLLEQVVAFQEKAKASKAPVTMEAIRFLRDWLEPHIRGADMHVGLHLRMQSMERAASEQDDAKLAI